MAEVKERKVIELPSFLTVRELAALMKASPIDVIKELMANGIMANINQQIDYETAAIVAEEMGFEARPEAPPEEEQAAAPEVPAWKRLVQDEDPKSLRPRPPVVTVMGHVDHGKTSLLDAIRHTNVVAAEVGGITQHIGAYQVEHNGRKITFLDTPGHEAFTAMRARGAQVTDIAVLVVAADDGVMPQTREAIAHARAAHVPILVALNKIDKPTANPERVKQQLADLGLVPDEWGGETLVVPVSAKQKKGIEDLLEAILLIADEMGIKANPNRPAVGTVIEAELDKTRGPMATLLVQNGTLHVGDTIVVGKAFGRIRAMLDERGKPIKSAGPSTPVSVLGLSAVPAAGEVFEVVADERTARALVAERLEAQRQTAEAPRPLSLEEIYARFKTGQARELNLIVKADVQGSLEPIVSSLEKLDREGLKINILHQEIGNITESDVMLASASHAIIIGFSVQVDEAARRLAESEGVDIRVYDVIYKLIEDVDKALAGLLEPQYEEVTVGKAEVRQLFRVPKVGIVAGCYVNEGAVQRNAQVRVIRNGKVVHTGPMASLKRFTEDVREVRAGYECGLHLDGFDGVQVGDVLEFVVKQKVE